MLFRVVSLSKTKKVYTLHTEGCDINFIIFLFYLFVCEQTRSP